VEIELAVSGGEVVAAVGAELASEFVVVKVCGVVVVVIVVAVGMVVTVGTVVVFVVAVVVVAVVAAVVVVAVVVVAVVVVVVVVIAAVVIVAIVSSKHPERKDLLHDLQPTVEQQGAVSLQRWQKLRRRRERRHARRRSITPARSDTLQC
jgi:flagellar motor component MotA